nr:subtilisin-like protease SBT1.5 [Ipomoea trifida]
MVFYEFASEGDISVISKGVVVQQAGGAGIITVNPPSEGQFIMAQPHLIPASLVIVSDGDEIQAVSASPTATSRSFIRTPIPFTLTKLIAYKVFVFPNELFC